VKKSWKEVLDETVPRGSLATTPPDFQQRVEKARRSLAQRIEAEADIEKVSFSADGGVVLRILVDADDLDPGVMDASSDAPFTITKLTLNGVPIDGAKLRDPQRSETSGKIAFTLTGSVANKAMPAVRSMPLSMSAKITATSPVFQGFKVVLPRS
jgi:hypothetical protein